MGADIRNINPFPEFLNEIANLLAWRHRIAREEAAGSFGERLDHAGAPPDFKRQPLAVIASGKNPMSVQKEDTWRTLS